MGVQMHTSVRKMQKEQGANLKFRSRLDQLNQIDSEDLAAFIAMADVCTRRVPQSARHAQVQIPIFTDMHGGTSRFYMVYWMGNQNRWGWHGPLENVGSQGIQLFEGQGWRRVNNTDAELPVFFWQRRSVDFPAYGSEDAEVPLIRPFPHEFVLQL